jgi:uncharacterized phage-associated protein
MLQFPLDVLKTVQAIGVLFRQDAVRRMNWLRVLKLLYLADRESLKETGRPISGGPMAAMKHGPVLEEVYDLIRGQHGEMPLWGEYLRRIHYDLELVKEPDVKKLSRYEIAKLQEIARRHADDGEWALSDLTHDFPEWQKNNPGNGSCPLPLEDTLAAAGLDPAAVAAIQKEAHDLAFFNRLLR